MNELRVSVNPEIGLIINGRRKLIKLYLKEETLRKEIANVSLTLMREVIDAQNYDVVILDVRRNKMHTLEKSSEILKAVVRGEALLFNEVWKELWYRKTKARS